MIDPVTASNDRLRETSTSRWGYTGEMIDDPAPLQDTSDAKPWLIWAALLVVAAVVVIALFANPM